MTATLPDFMAVIFNADLRLKITAMKSGKVAVIPTFREVVTQLIPNYFGEVFNKNFTESRLKKEEYFEISIPYLDDPKIVANVIRNVQSDELTIGVDVHTCNDFYSVADYFQIDDMLQALVQLAVSRPTVSTEKTRLLVMMSIRTSNRREFDQAFRGTYFCNENQERNIFNSLKIMSSNYQLKTSDLESFVKRHGHNNIGIS